VRKLSLSRVVHECELVDRVVQHEDNLRLGSLWVVNAVINAIKAATVGLPWNDRDNVRVESVGLVRESPAPRSTRLHPDRAFLVVSEAFDSQSDARTTREWLASLGATIGTPFVT
jgi:hypothetical protein